MDRQEVEIIMKAMRRITEAYFRLACRQYSPLINKLAVRIGQYSSNVEALKSAGLEELLRCMIRYDRRGSFMTFVYGQLRYRFMNERASEMRANRIKTTQLDFDNSQEITVSNVEMLMEELFKCLTPQEFDIITELFYGRRTTREIAQDMAVVHSTVCRTKQKAIMKMHRRY